MRRFISFLSALVVSFLFLGATLSPAYVMADAFNPFGQACNGEGASSTACQQDGTKNPISGKDGIIFKAINIFSFLIGVASVIMIMVGGVKYIASSGDSAKLTSAKSTILYAVIGIVVFLLSRGIIAFVVNKL